jgi:hypothetical protein
MLAPSHSLDVGVLIVELTFLAKPRLRQAMDSFSNNPFDIVRGLVGVTLGSIDNAPIRLPGKSSFQSIDCGPTKLFTLALWFDRFDY